MLLVSLGLSHFRARNGYSIGDTDFQNTCKRLKYGGACRDRTCDHLIKSQTAYLTKTLLLQDGHNNGVPLISDFTRSFPRLSGVFRLSIGDDGSRIRDITTSGRLDFFLILSLDKRLHRLAITRSQWIWI